MVFLWLVLGMILLIKGADWLVEGAVSIALNLGVSKLIVGLSVVAFGTSIPELVASVVSVLKGHSSVSISNVVGSNVANIGLCLAVGVLFSSVNIRKQTMRIEVPFMIISTFVFFSLLIRNGAYLLQWNDGIVFLSLMIVYIYYIVTSARDVIEEELESEIRGKYKTLTSVMLVLIGIAGVSLGGELTIRNVVEIAKMFGLSETFVGLTIVAIGTSLPELVVSITSIVKGEGDILVGNIVGSNIFNILLILGISSLIGNLTVDVRGYYIDLFVMIGIALLLLIFSFTRRKLTRVEGILLLSIYITYILYVFQRK
ncbi:calcium/sodium antiporter [Thermosipho ferrireducens]|uniref:Calcium/sodium antiporter n=1 Tax=Thermosipho ferrireducens TaxID=2571116 RepID=A0ABX7S6V8_9BACT|nr:calcium/sodium antiporter [Thermosipho ferrireducens]QTA37505.1 calcium/sodium antiporter [Thermosipho ferrireducens]